MKLDQKISLVATAFYRDCQRSRNPRLPSAFKAHMNKLFTRFSNNVSEAAGKPATFELCCIILIAWAISGPFMGFSETWQLIVNTGTTIITFLMVFLIQNTQNRDGAAVQAKLDELIRTSKAQNAFIGIEHLTDRELKEIRKKCEERAKGAEDAENRAA